MLHNLFLVYFVNLYMFRVYLCPSSGGTTVCVQELVHTYILVHTHIRTYIYIYIHTYIRTHTYTHTYIHTYIHTLNTKYITISQNTTKNYCIYCNLMFFDRASWIDYTLITNSMHWLLFIHKILFSSTGFEHQVLIFRRI